MSVLYTLLEQARSARARLEAEQAQQVSLYGGYRELLKQRIRRLADSGDEEAMSVLKRLTTKMEER